MKRALFLFWLIALFLIGLIIGILAFPFLAYADMSVDRYFEELEESQEPETEDKDALTRTDNFVFNSSSMLEPNVKSTAIASSSLLLTGYAEAGKRSTSEDYEEEGTDDDYSYYDYHLKLGQKISDRISYDIGSFIYDKHYNTKDSLDNISRTFKTNWSYYLMPPQERLLELGFKLNYKEKRYENSPGSEYNRITAAPLLSFTEKDLYAIDVSAGVDEFNYLETGEKDQLNFFSKIGGKRYFLDKKLMLTSSYKIETLEQEIINRERTKQEALGGFDYLFDGSTSSLDFARDGEPVEPLTINPKACRRIDFPWLYKITTRVGWGQRDTKEDEERDEDYDYEYWSGYVKSEHRINRKLKTGLKYQYFKKDYISGDLNNRGFYIQNNWDYEILDDEKQKIWLDLGIEYKGVDYTLEEDNNYKKEIAEIKLSYQKKKNSLGHSGWKTSLVLEGNSYDYNDSINNKKRYYIKLSGEKLFLKERLALSLDLKYRYTDYEQGNDKEQEAVRVAFKYRF
ncbi:MAG: hypothetical protein Q8O30_03300 [Candidatus Omnitrophota bacterium]|nr:hypothetical protein [Candidatus Omnitrophota bacterium]